MTVNDETENGTETENDFLNTLSVAERERLVLLAERGTRKMLLWELGADENDYCGIKFVAVEFGIADAPPEEQVEAFIADMDAHMADYQNQVDFTDLEARYGDKADVLEAEAESLSGSSGGA